MNSLALQSIAAAKAASWLVALMAVLVLVGWSVDLPGLTRLYLPGPSVKTNAAVSLALAALANLLLLSARERRSWILAGRVLAFATALVGALTLAEHLFAWDIRIDQLLATEPAGALATASPNRMGPPASTSLLLLGLALLLADSRAARWRRWSHGLALTTCVISILPLIGYAYQISSLYVLARYTGIALSSAGALLLLAVAILAGRPEWGLAGLLCRSDEAGTLSRRLLPAALMIPFGMGWALSRLVRDGTVEGAFAISGMALTLIAVFTVLIWQTSTRVALSLDARRAMERALSESERSLREADRQKTEFLATLSHELRNPLAPIRFALELLDGPPDAARRARQTIGRQVQHLTRLIDDLLDLTRITRNKLQLHLRSVELRAVINDAVDTVAGEIEQRGHRLDVHMPDQPVWLRVDPDRIVQIVTNLLTNAARYTDNGGSIVVRASVENADVVIAVRDTGAGLNPADLSRVFERFVQVGETRSPGLGIGLALVKGLAELHNGSVSAHSEGLGRGAEFRVRLPRSSAPVPQVAQEPSGAPPQLHRFLIVDDNRDAADMLREVLTARGHDVLVAYDGNDALHRAPGFQPTVGLLDIGMPGMNGYDLARKLRRDLATANAFLVAITGWGQERDRRQALEAGFDAHLTKPADPDVILALVADRFGSFVMQEEDSTVG